MQRHTVPSRSHLWPRVAVLLVVGASVAGCSDSARFDSNPYASNNRQASTETTGSVGGTRPMYRPIQSQPLPAISKPATVQASNTGYSSGSTGLGTYRPGAVTSSDITGSVQTPAKPAGHWTWDGGQPVTVGAGETVETIARRYGVPASAITQTNNLGPNGAVYLGQRLVIPRYINGAAVAAPAQPQVAAVPSAPAPVAPATPRIASSDNVHVVQPGETLIAISRRYGVPLATLAKANNMPVYQKVSMGDRIAIPGGARVQTQTSARPMQQTQMASAAPSVSAPQPMQSQRFAPPQLAKVQSVPAETARVAKEEPAAAVQSENPVKQAEATGAMPSFRWPVKGRIISGFGQAANGTTNDGINLAVPEGTPVKAAEDGVVAYAGNELKGYGNLVLVRHSNGYVSAYANASEILVKRGDSVKRGQTIASAGQTGNVTSPQLHFEIRKGSTPVDPTKYLGNI